MKTWRRRLLWIVGLAMIASVVAVATIDRWLFAALHPGPFDPADTPPAPDYADPNSWAALPELDDAADVALPTHPATSPAQAAADVFYVHPTTFVAADWNARIDDPAIVEATSRGGTLIQASAFNACCAVYAPRYRQAHGRAFTEPDDDGRRAIEVAYTDVSAAFDAFLARTGERPFILAGHSQGAILAGRLLNERIAGGPLEQRLVAAYLPGAALRADAVRVPVCASSTQIGCVISWNARGPGYRPNRLELDAADPETMIHRLCVNPISWLADGSHAPADRMAGALFFDTDTPTIEPAFADAQCIDGALVITRMGELERDTMSRILLWVVGPDNFHPIEYQLFYMDIRNNASQRVEVWRRARAD